jgi:hypothetical protein
MTRIRSGSIETTAATIVETEPLILVFTQAARLLALLKSGPCTPSPISVQPQACYGDWWETQDRDLYFRAIPFGYLRYLYPRDLYLADLLIDPSHRQMKGPQIITDPPHLSSHVKSGPALVSSCSIGAVKYAIKRISTEITNHRLCARAGVFPASVNAPLEISAPLTLVPCVCIITTLIRYHRIMEYLRDYCSRYILLCHLYSTSASLDISLSQD